MSTVCYTGSRATAEGRPYTRPLPLCRPAPNTQGLLVGAGLRAGPSPNNKAEGVGDQPAI